MPTLVSVVVPCFNEEENIPILAARIAEVFASLPNYDYECLFVDDGSTDNSRAVLAKLQTDNPHVRPIHLARNKGQSAALIAGMRRAHGEFILSLDGDMQNDPCDFPRMLELLQQYDVVCGYRANRRDTWVRKLSSRVANAVRQWALHDGLRDSGCGSKGYRRKCAALLVPFNGQHRFVGAVLRAAGCSIVECPVTHHPRLHGTSKYGIANRLWRGIYDLFGVSWLTRRYVAFHIEGEE